MSDLSHTLERTLVIRARRATVFSFFTDSDRWAAWWGRGSTIEAHVDGHVLIRHPNGLEAFGKVVQIAAPDHISFTYATADGPQTSSLVTIRLHEHPTGTLLHLSHVFPTAGERDAHIQGWRFHLSVFANRVSDLVIGSADALVDRWFAMWNDTESARRAHALSTLVDSRVTFNDRFSCVATEEDLVAHLGAVHRFMPGVQVARTGPVRHCQWRALADWVATGSDGAERGRGTNVFDLDADGRIIAVAGFWW